MIKYLLDTGLIIRHLRGQRRIVQLMRRLGKSSRLAISTVTLLEVYNGMYSDEEYATKKLLSRFTSLDMDRNVAERAGKLTRLLRERGHTIGIADTVIAATALQQDITLVTLNIAHFKLVPGVRIYPLDDDVI